VIGSARLAPSDLLSMPLDDVIRLCTGAPDGRDRELARRFVDGVFEAQVARRSRRKCWHLGHLGRRDCPAWCDRAFPSATDCYRREIDRTVASPPVAPLAAIQSRLNHVRDADVRRAWNSARGLVVRIQQSDFAPGNLARRCVEGSVAVLKAAGVSEDDAKVSALRDLFAALGGARGDGPTVELLCVAWSDLQWFTERIYDDACDVASPDDVPHADRLARRLCSDLDLDAATALAGVRARVQPAWQLARQVLGYAPEGERSFWERIDRAYAASRIEGTSGAGRELADGSGDEADEEVDG